MIRLIKGIIRFFIRRPLYFLKRNAKNAIVVYLLGFLPSSYSLTALTTGIPLTNPTEVVSTLKESGVANILSGGFLAPIGNGIKNVAGNTLQTIGELTGNTDIVQTGENLSVAASSWFNQGKEFVDKASKGATDIANKVDETISKVTDGADKSTEPAPTTGEEEYVWTFTDYPDYYRVLGLSTIDPASFPQPTEIVNTTDDKGRAGIAKGTLTYANFDNSRKTKPLKADGKTKLDVNFTGNKDKPSGWPDKNVKKVIPWQHSRYYEGYFWNKSHLIADSLGGEATAANAITGTRAQNVGGPNNKGGMAYGEIKVREYFKSHKDGVVYYSAEPKYNGDELIPRTVIVNIKSQDNVLDEEIEVFNTANGWKIDYNNGNLTNE